MPSQPSDVAQATAGARVTALARVAALCSCHTSSMPTPAGEIIVVRVFGDVDLSTEHVLRSALAEARRRRPSHLVVDIAGMGFCSVRGLALLADDPTEEAARRAPHLPGAEQVLRARYLLAGVEPRIERYLGLLWLAGTLPVRYPSAGAAVLAAMAQQRRRHGREPLTPHRTEPAARSREHVDRFGGVTDDELTERARGGDCGAYRELSRRHRTRVYHSALRMLGSAEDPEDVAEDITARLRAALAAFSEADPP